MTLFLKNLNPLRIYSQYKFKLIICLLQCLVLPLLTDVDSKAFYFVVCLYTDYEHTPLTKPKHIQKYICISETLNTAIYSHFFDDTKTIVECNFLLANGN